MSTQNDPFESIMIDIVDANESRRFDPNGIIMALIEGLTEKLVPIPGKESVCSGEPAVIYRTSEAALLLTPPEVLRITMHALTPDEYFKLVEAVGHIFELHDDFYDERTGEAVDPKMPVGSTSFPSS